ncbi:hypothetical protein HPB50_019853 [Hyalomma asiaticum]|uniref:Uncharacterized protein n=1 Tax=Hyalomma asiaticum TaxID=266040 RepID=A0ACB7RME9_HYAAI|nr:hypothetical protein HPB50_019853 [Hyalomma asiaticum]
MALMAHPFCGAVMEFRVRGLTVRGLRLAFFVGALAASVATAVHGQDDTMVQLERLVNNLQKCDTATAMATAHGATVNRGLRASENRSDTLHKRALCPWRLSFDYDHLRIPANLTTVECLCRDDRCLPLNDYRCATVLQRFRVEYNNGTRRDIDLPVACACAKSVTGGSSDKGIRQTQ